MRSRLLLLSALLVTIAVIVGCNSTNRPATNTSVSSASPGAPTSDSPQVPTVNADGVRRITIVELRDLLAKNEAVVVDVRNEASYKQGHIPGSKLIPLAEVVNKVNELPKNKLIVTYCA